MTDPDQSDDSDEPRHVAAGRDETRRSAAPDADRDATRPSRRQFLQAGGVALGIGAVGNAGAHDQHRGNQIQSMQETTETDGDEQDSSLRTTRQVSLSMGKQIADAMEQQAEEIGVPSVVTVADADGNLVAQRRMNNAWLPSVNISRNKAYTAAGFEMPTHELADVTTPGESLWGLQVTDESRIVVFGGGYPLETGGDVVGAVGSSGGSVEQDREVASAGVERFEELVE